MQLEHLESQIAQISSTFANGESEVLIGLCHSLIETAKGIEKSSVDIKREWDEARQQLEITQRVLSNERAQHLESVLNAKAAFETYSRTAREMVQHLEYQLQNAESLCGQHIEGIERLISYHGKPEKKRGKNE